jgi:hypothetical protein
LRGRFFGSFFAPPAAKKRTKQTFSFYFAGARGWRGAFGRAGLFGALPQTPPKNFLKKVFGTFKNFLVFRPSRK